MIGIILSYPVWATTLLSNEIKNSISVQYLVILILLLLIIPIAFGFLLQKLLYRILKSKYYIHLFQLVLILLCLSILVVTIFIASNIKYNHTIEKTLALAIGIFFASLAFSSKVVSKNEYKNEDIDEKQ